MSRTAGGQLLVRITYILQKFRQSQLKDCEYRFELVMQ